jgi:two-component system, OmpR family, sensor histidine kinase TctE
VAACVRFEASVIYGKSTMNDDLPRPTSIRRRLLIFLISSAVLMVSGATAATYWIALHVTNNAYDRSLLDPAFDIADNVRLDKSGAHVDLPQKALEALVYDQVDKVIYQVRSRDNEIVDGVSDLPSPPAIEAGGHLFFDGTYHGEKIRIAALRSTAGFVVQIGETLHKRNRLVGEILVAGLVSTTLVALGSIALAWFGVTRGLRPFEQLRVELTERAPTDLRSLSAAGAPIEIAPVVSAFNGLLGHLRDANAMQQRFLANAAHQLRTPLAGLQMHLELLSRRELPADVRTELDRMHSATVRASRLANQLLALAKAEGAPQGGREYEIVDLLAVAGAAARDWAPRAFDLKIDLGFSLEHAVILGDSLLLPELVDNLIDNALRYTPAGGRVTVATGFDDGVPYLGVEDTGPGIPAAERGKVLERFYRVAGTAGEGSGLGLAIVREVVDRHDAELTIDASGDHGGTRVRVTFPRNFSSEDPVARQ